MSSDRLNKGDIVLVTGATGLVGASVVDELASRGFKVRGVTRDVGKTQPMKEKVDRLYGPGLIEFVELHDSTKPGAYKPLLKGVAGVVHVGIDYSTIFTPESTFDTAVNASRDMTLNLFKSANEISTIKSIVVTGSCSVVYHNEFGKDVKVTSKDWDEENIKLAKEAASDSPNRMMLLYVAAKALAEKGIWEWVEKTKPSFAVNIILPHLVLGHPFNPADGVYSSSTWLKDVFNGDTKSIIVGAMSPGYWVVDVVDCAVIHVGALLASDVNHERLWAASQPAPGINKVLAIWRKAYPDREFPADYDFPEQPKQEFDRESSTALLKRYAGREWRSLEEIALATVQN